MIESIAEHIKKLDRAQNELRAVIKHEQKTCKHPQIIHANWRSSDWGSPFEAQRLCLACGLEEDGGHGDDDHCFRRLKSKGFHKVVSHGELWGARFPEAELDEKREAERQKRKV